MVSTEGVGLGWGAGGEVAEGRRGEGVPGGKGGWGFQEVAAGGGGGLHADGSGVVPCVPKS